MLILREVPRPGVRLSAGLTAAETTAALALAHTAAGGTLPPAPWLLAVAATVYGASLPVLRGRVPIRIVLPALVALQLLLHAWSVALTSGAGLHAHQHAPGVLGLSWPMLLAHVAAGTVAAVAWALRRRAVDILLGWCDAPLPGIAHRDRVVLQSAPPTLRWIQLTTRPTRGPPRALPAAA